MDVIFTISSIAALAELSLKAYSAAARLVKDIRDAPDELSRVVQQLNILHCEISLLSDIQKQVSEGDDLLILSGEATLLTQALSSAYDLISNVEKNICKYNKQTGKRARFIWALKEKERVDDLFKKLKDTESSLNTVLLLVNVRLSSYSWKIASSVQSKTADALHSQNECTQKDAVETKTLPSLFNRNPQTWNVFFGSWRSANHPWLAWCGLHAILTSYCNSLHTTYFLSGTIILGRWIGLQTLYFNLGLRTFPFSRFGLKILGGSLSPISIVPETSEIIIACQRGDVRTVQLLFVSRRASPYDITPANTGPIRYAIESGSLDLVQYLCENGVDINSPFGKHNTSPLEWAFFCRNLEIARYLISHGAQLDYLCARGWTPVMHLFWSSSAPAPMEFFHLLSAHSFSDFDVQDQFGTTALHRAARWGSPEDVHALLKMGASPSVPDRSRGWTPVFEAVNAKSTTVLKALAGYMLADFVNSVDVQGRSLFSVAIQTGCLETIRLVLGLGADPHQLLRITDKTGRVRYQMDLLEFSRMQGPDTYSVFSQALQLAGLGVSVLGGDNGEEDDVFWPAE